MGVNNAEDSLIKGLTNELAALRREFEEFRNTPQMIGNGSINYVFFSVATLGPYNVAAGGRLQTGLDFMPYYEELTWNGLPAIARPTLLDPLFSIYIDAQDDDHLYWYGDDLTTAQKNLYYYWHMDYRGSDLTQDGGQRRWLLTLLNFDTSAHNYWISISACMPRPALKPR